MRQGGEIDHRRKPRELSPRHVVAFLGQQHRLPRPART
jgi:hypothetical protein